MRQDPPPRPRPQLRLAIHTRLAAEERRATRRQLAWSITLASAAAITCVPLVRNLHQESIRSGFAPLLILLISDPDIILAYGHDVALAAAELLPSVPFALTLAMATISSMCIHRTLHAWIRLRHRYGIS